MRKKIVAGNWKMNLNLEEGVSLFSEVQEMVKDEVTGNQSVIVCAPYIHLNSLAKLKSKENKALYIGAQNLHQEDSGAYTGEISGSQLKTVGVEYVIVGHSERRAYFGETNEQLAEKVNAALKNGLLPIYCFGEQKEEREDKSYFKVIEAQVMEALFHLDTKDFSQVVLAYEPVWAIGTGLTASPEQAQEVHAYVREVVAKHYGQEVADSVTILYGGSCKPSNAQELFSQKDIDGGLIGGASLTARDFIDIAKVFNS